ncbi:MAG TPA: methyl-accepting chemotaxis protein [Deltaproteobacteria bacterium]|nr:methyl-accepting chemotaxis protein [Deltaproteobacteria bacterium]HQB38282.1 methyl-accepting chemotaxis protein [Deltaproteobacteria bacterium]
MTIRTKLFFSSFISIIGIIIIAALSLVTIISVRDKINVLTSHSTPLQVKTMQFQQSVEKLSAELLQLGLSSDPQEAKQISDAIAEQRKRLEQAHNEINTLKKMPAETAVFAELHEQVLKATDEKFKSMALFREEAAKVNRAMARVDKSLLELKELISSLVISASRRASTATKTLNESISEKKTVPELLVNVRNFRNEVDHDIALNKKINAISDLVYAVGVDAKLLDAKTRMIMLSQTPEELHRVTAEAQAINARISRNVNQVGQGVRQIKSSGYVDDTMRAISSSIALAGASLRTISTSQKGVLENMSIVDSSLKRVRAVAMEQARMSESNVQATAHEQQQSVKEVGERVELFNTLLIAVSITTIVVALILSISTTISISRSLKGMTATIVSIAETGDFTKTIAFKNRDEFGITMQAFNSLIGSFTRIIAAVSQSSGRLAGCSRDLTGTAQEIHRNIDAQSTGIVQVSAASSEVARSVNLITGNTARIADSAREAGEMAASGAEIVSRTSSEVSQIALAVEESTRLMRTLQEHSQQVGEIVDVIVEITDQTNLLALNAAIEAARAGDHGRGFAVVANEVRTLANNTARATVGITERVKRIQADTELAVEAMHNSLERVHLGVELSSQAGDSLQRIVSSVASLQEMTGQIAIATSELAQSSSEISADIIAIERASAENVMAAADIAKESEMLSQLSSELKNEISRFRFNEPASQEPLPSSKTVPGPAAEIAMTDVNNRLKLLPA